MTNVSVLVTIGVNDQGYRKILGVCEGAKEDKAGWSSFLRHLKERGLTGVRLFITDACMGLVESLTEFYPQSRWQRCTVHVYRNVFSVVPARRMAEVAAMLEAIHASEDKKAALEKTEAVFAKLEAIKLEEAAKKVQESIAETLSYHDVPREHHIRIRTNDARKRVRKEFRRRTRVVGAFPDGHSASIPCAARLRHIAGTKWGTKRCLTIDLLREQKLYQQLEGAEAV